MRSVNFLPSALPLTRTLSKGSRLLKRLGQTYSIEQRCSMTSPFNLTGKAALVTGGNGGIGLGIARGLAQAGARVAGQAIASICFNDDNPRRRPGR